MIKLHLGCGKRNFGPEWTHIDVGDYPHLHSHDIVNLPFGDNTCEIVYASHVLPYFDRKEVKDVLLEWYRVLKPGGIVRLSVSDFGVMAKLYLDKEYTLDSFLGPMYGKMFPDGLEKPIYEKTVYDFVSLEQLLDNCWFKNIRRWDWRTTEHAKFDDHSQAYLPRMDKERGTLISLNIEATK